MKWDSVLINMLTWLSYTDYTQQLFNKYFWYILKYVSQSDDCRQEKKRQKFIQNRQTAAHQSSFLVQILCTSRYDGTTIKKENNTIRQPHRAKSHQHLVWRPCRLTGPHAHRPQSLTDHAGTEPSVSAWAVDNTCRLPLNPNKIYSYPSDRHPNKSASVRHRTACPQLF